MSADHVRARLQDAPAIHVGGAERIDGQQVVDGGIAGDGDAHGSEPDDE